MGKMSNLSDKLKTTSGLRQSVRAGLLGHGKTETMIDYQKNLSPDGRLTILCTAISIFIAIILAMDSHILLRHLPYILLYVPIIYFFVRNQKLHKEAETSRAEMNETRQAYDRLSEENEALKNAGRLPDRQTQISAMLDALEVE